MDQTAKWLSPKSASGSFFLAIAAHGALLGVVAVMLSMGLLKFNTEVTPTSEEIAYETFSEPPTAAPVVKAVAQVQPDEHSLLQD